MMHAVIYMAGETKVEALQNWEANVRAEVY